MDVIRLKQTLDSFNGSEIDLYNAINFIDKPSNEFDYYDYNEVLYKFMYLFHKKYGIENISKVYKAPLIVNRDISFAEFKQYLEELKKFKIKVNPDLPNVKTYFDNIYRVASYKLLDRDSWTKVYSEKITGEDVSDVGKMYLSVDNRDLYKFANLLLDQCLDLGLEDYCFKVNADDSLTRRDNVVIYFTSDNFYKYISMINKILADNPNILLNEQSALGYSINENIKIGFDFDDGAVSYTEKLCKMILNLLQEGKSSEVVAEYVNKYMEKRVTEFLNSTPNTTN